MNDDERKPKWLAEILAIPPPVESADQRLARERADRGADMRRIAGNIEALGGLSNVGAMVKRIRHEELATLAMTWHLEAGQVVVLGETGLGKTTAVAVLIRRLMGLAVRDGGPAWGLARGLAWHRAQELERAVKAHPLGKGVPPALASAQGATLLVLDDVGWETEARIIAEVYAARYDAGLPTITTSGRDLPDLIAHYGDAIVRRMTTHRGRPGKLARAFPQRDAEAAKQGAAKRTAGGAVVPFNERAER